MSKRFFFFGAARGFEPETIAYLNTIGILNNSTIYFPSTAQETAGEEIWIGVNDFFVYCKNIHSLPLGISNLLTVYDVIWGFIGDNATMLKYNSINPLDTNAANRLTFFGGWGLGPTGITPNATNAYANTYWDGLSKAGPNRLAYGYYKRTQGTTGLSGTWDLNNISRVYEQNPILNFTIGNTGGLIDDQPYLRAHSVVARSGDTKVFSDGVEQYNTGAVTFSPVSIPFFIGARNNNNVSINNYTNGEYSCYWFSGKVEFTDQQMLDMNDAVNNLQVALKRNV